ncbi:hypothetical protein ACO0LD_28785 [Undibacterium sp. Ji83W]|uniref:hypothetical protein n=1 Tax=Undibacterium sp. Ji83W TaxID=3413043 RepID=UPI003BF229D5
MDAFLTRDAESKLIQQHPAQARRPSEHVLEVKYANGAKRFIDKPPHESLGGTHWFYCGYNAAQNLHLIGHTVDSLFSGVILRHSDGLTFRAGHTILMSPEGKKFLAIEQPDGLDGEEWAVYKLYGKKLWQGYAGILSTPVKNDPVMVIAQFVNPAWRDDNVLEADLSCADIVKGKVSLHVGKAAPRWSLPPAC